MKPTATQTRIAEQNDAFRRQLIGAIPGLPGQTVMTRSIAALPSDTVAAILQAVRRFDAFTPDNDPHHEHDFGTVEVDGHRAFFKFDYFENAQMEYGAEDATRSYRVMTVMLAEDY